MTQVTAVIQARTGSTRYPGKVLRPIAGIPMIEHIINRLQQVSEFDRIVVAIPDKQAEEPLAAIALQSGADLIRGPEEDVLQRFILAGENFGANNILRICGDSPLTDLALVRSLIHRHLAKKADYTCPADPVPLGTGAEVVRLSALKEAHENSDRPAHREHVTTYFHDHPESFAVEKVAPPSYLRGKSFRLTVDTEDDFLLMDEVYRIFFSSRQSPIDLEQVILHLESHPELANLNGHIMQKDWRRDIP